MHLPRFWCGHIVALLASWLVTAEAHGQQAATNFVLKVTPERRTAIYRVGELVKFNLELTLGQQSVLEAEVYWTITKDGMPPVTRGKVKLTNGMATVTGRLEEPGFLLCRASFTSPQQRGYIGLGAAGVDPLQIKPSQPVPEDFDAFWPAQKRLLGEVAVNARLTPVKSPQTGVVAFDLQVDSVGAPVSGYYAKPEGAIPNSRPVILLVHGAGVRDSSLAGASGWAKRGFLALDINAHGLPNGQSAKFY